MSVTAASRGGVAIPSTEPRFSGPLQNAALPSVAIVPFVQHTGAPAVCAVRPGDVVTEGMEIGRPDGLVSCAVHSPIPGVVTEITDITLPNGTRSQAAHIRLEGGFDRLRRGSRASIGGLPDEGGVLRALAEMGVAGLDAANLPLQLAWRRPKGILVDCVVIDAIRAEPLLMVDEVLLNARTADVVLGLQVIRLLFGEQVKLVLAVSGGGGPSLPPGVDAVCEAAARSGAALKVVTAGVTYPFSNEVRLVELAAGRSLKHGTRPIDAGVLVVDPSTLVAAADAVFRRQPLIERSVIIGGGAIRRQAVLKVRVGTRIGDLIAECGGFTEVPERVVCGGPMTGGIVHDLNAPVTKSTRGVFGLTAAETGGGTRSPCIGCGRCVGVCPEGLDPSQLFKHIEHGELSAAQELGVLDCIECGACSYVCPSHLPLTLGLRLGKQLVRASRERS